MNVDLTILDDTTRVGLTELGRDIVVLQILRVYAFLGASFDAVIARSSA